jgi:AraC-like DNA-binding protein
MSQRTLARRLAAEGLSFTIILDEMKFDLARHYLMEADLPITTIAWLLGYQEVSAFTRAFGRWTGKTPKQARNKPAVTRAGRYGDAQSEDVPIAVELRRADVAGMNVTRPS